MQFVLLFSIFTIATAGCPQGWVNLDDERCLFFSTTLANYVDASGYCLSFGSKLAEPLTPAESHFIGTEVYKRHSSHYYIGITDRFQEGTWMYLSSGTVVPFADWGVGEPVLPNGWDEDCLVIAETPTNQGHWADVTCNRTMRYVCEKSVPSSIEGEIIG